MGLNLFSCCIGHTLNHSYTPGQAPHEKRGGSLPNAATYVRPETNTVSADPFTSRLSTIVQELLVRLPQVTETTWISRLESSTSLLSSITEVDAASITLIFPGDGGCAAMPCASLVCGVGPQGALLQQYQQQGQKAALASAARSAEEPLTSADMIASGLHGDVLLLGLEGDSTYNSAVSAGPLAPSGTGASGPPIGTGGTAAVDLPVDWATVASTSHLRHFCGLALRAGPTLLAIVTLAWAASCPVPPGLRSRSMGGEASGNAAGTGLGGDVTSGSLQLTSPQSSSAAVSPPPPRRPSAAAAAAGCRAGIPAGPTEAELSCLQQLAQVFSLGLFGDTSNVVYGQKVARMVHAMTQAMTLQAALDGCMTGVREILLHRCQQELVATLALKHTSASTAAFILQGRSGGPVSPPPTATVPPRGSTVSGHVTAPPASVPQRSLQQVSSAVASAGGGGGGGGSLPPYRPSTGPGRGTHQPSASSHPSPPGSVQVQGNAAVGSSAGGSAHGQAAAPAGAVSSSGVTPSYSNTIHSNNVNTATNYNNPSNPAASQTSAGGNNNVNQNQSSLLFSGGGGGGGGGGVGSTLGATASTRVSVSSHFHRLRSGGGGAGGGGGNTMSGVFRHAMSVELGGSIEVDYNTSSSTVHAHVTSLADTLFMASLSREPEAADEGSVITGGTRVTAGSRHTHVSGSASDRDSIPPGKRDLGGYLALQGRATGGGRSMNPTASSIGGGGGGGGANLTGVVPGVFTNKGSIIPNCHVLVQDESLPCRDLVLVQKLTRMPVQSLVLVIIRPLDVASSFAALHGALLAHSTSNTRQQAQQTTTTSMTSGGGESMTHMATLLSSTMPVIGLYLASPDPLGKSALARVMLEAREAMRLAAVALYRQVTQGSLQDEWTSLMEAMSTTSGTGRMNYGSSRMVSLLRPRSCHILQEQASSDLLQYGIVNNPSRVHLGTSPGVLSSELSKHLASGRLVVDSSVEQPLQQLDAMVSSIQSTLSAVQLQLDVPGGGGDMQEVRLNDIAAVELMEIIGRGGQGVVFRGMVHGIEAAAKVISHRDGPDDSTVPGVVKPGPASANSADRRAGGGPVAGAAPSQDSPMVDEARMRERKRNLLRDALELAVTITISHPNIVQMYGYFTDCVVVQYANQPNRLKLLPADSEALQQYGSQRGPVNTVMCMEFCDAGTLKTVAEAGAFRLPGVSAKSGPACPALVPLYTSLLEVALALRHLHGRRLVHCDLKPSNVLLKSSLRDPRGWICKLSDFGCVRVMNEEGEEGRLGFRQPQPLGTLTHMAPEMFVRGGLLDAAIDIYAFGIIMWELIMVAPLYDGTVPKEKLPSMIRRGLRPIFHPLVPPDYRMLAAACWQEDARRRPTAGVLVSTLQRLLVRAHASAGSSSSFGGGGTTSTKSMSSSFSGIGAAPAVDSSDSPAISSGGQNPQHRQIYAGAVPRRNTVASNLGMASQSHGGHSGGGGGAAAAASSSSASALGNSAGGLSSQRQAFPPAPLPSPLSREAGPTARAAVRLGDGSGAKAVMRNLEAPMNPQSAAGGPANPSTLSPLSTGLGPAPQPALLGSPPAIASTTGGMRTRGVLSPGVQTPLDDAAAGPSSGASALLGAGAAADAAAAASSGAMSATAARLLDARASSLLGIGNSSIGDRNARSSNSAAAAAAVTAAVSGDAAAAAAAAAAASQEPRGTGGSSGGAAGFSPQSGSEVTLPVRASVFPTGSSEPLCTSTADAIKSGELVLVQPQEGMMTIDV